MKIVVLDGFLSMRGDLTFDALREFGDVTVYPNSLPEERIARIGDAQAVYVNRCELDRAVFEACPELRFVGVTGTGYNMVDLEAAKEHGVRVCNVPAYSSAAVAEMTFALLLEIARGTSFLNGYLHEGRWCDPSDETIARAHAFELCGRTLGIVGLGDIGRRVARMACAMDMRVLACRRSVSSGTDACGAQLTDLDTLLSESDIVSLHCPLCDATRGMISEENLRKMKPDAVLINTARGALLDEDAVIDALDSGHLYALGADVFAHEPPLEGDRLYRHPRCVATPHVAWAPTATRARLISVCAENLRRFMAGTPQNVIV